jgi:hypothetical protein
MKWYFRIHAPSMKANAGAIWPIVRHKKKWNYTHTSSPKYVDPRTVIHEEVHLKSQAVIGVIALLIMYFIKGWWFLTCIPILALPWLVLYGIMWLIKLPTGNAYKNNPFEVHAYEVGGGREDYIPFGWVKYIWKKNPTR